jgi:hypothetical protein
MQEKEERTKTFCNSPLSYFAYSHQASWSFLCACIGTQFLSPYNTIPCKASANGTPTVGTKIHGNVDIVEVLRSGLVITPRVTASRLYFKGCRRNVLSKSTLLSQVSVIEIPDSRNTSLLASHPLLIKLYRGL